MRTGGNRNIRTKNRTTIGQGFVIKNGIVFERHLYDRFITRSALLMKTERFEEKGIESHHNQVTESVQIHSRCLSYALKLRRWNRALLFTVFFFGSIVQAAPFCATPFESLILDYGLGSSLDMLYSERASLEKLKKDGEMTEGFVITPEDESQPELALKNYIKEQGKERIRSATIQILRKKITTTIVLNSDCNSARLEIAEKGEKKLQTFKPSQITCGLENPPHGIEFRAYVLFCKQIKKKKRRS